MIFTVRECGREIKASNIKIVNKHLDRDFNCIVFTSYRLVCDYSIANVNSFNSSIDCDYKIVDSYYKRFGEDGYFVVRIAYFYIIDKGFLVSTVY